MKALLLALLFSGAAKAEGYGWTAPTGTEALELTACEALLAVDVGMTAGMLGHAGTWEVNPILGERPSPARVFALGGAGMLATAGLWLALPRRVRWVVPLFVGAAEAVVVSHNFAVVLSW